MEFVPALALIALVLKVIDFLKAASNKDINALVTQATAWAGGVGVVLLFAQTDYAQTISVGDMSLATLNTWSQVVVGLGVSSAASTVSDALRAVDPTIKTKDHKLVPSAPEFVEPRA